VNDILKQRLVGALILLALGVVFWPIIFVAPDEQKVAEIPPVPPPPGISTAAVEAPQQAGFRGSPASAMDGDGPPLDGPLALDGRASDGRASEGSDERDAAAPPEEAAGQQGVSTPGNSPAGEVRSAAPQPLAMDPSGVPIAWTLQVATVSSAAKADELRNRLLASQEKAYVKQLEAGGKVLYRVSIGPNFERAQLEKIQPGIDSTYGVKSMIVRYAP